MNLIRETVSSHPSIQPFLAARSFIYSFLILQNIRALYRIYDFTYHNNIYLFIYFLSP